MNFYDVSFTDNAIIGFKDMSKVLRIDVQRIETEGKRLEFIGINMHG